jgi:hypothetical protein
LHLVGFQPFLTLLDTANNSSVRAGIQNVNGDIGFFSGSLFPMTIHNSGDVTIKGKLNGVDITALAARITVLEAQISQQAAALSQLNAQVGSLSAGLHSALESIAALSSK